MTSRTSKSHKQSPIYWCSCGKRYSKEHRVKWCKRRGHKRTDKVCRCLAYPFPHRDGGGLCGNPYGPEPTEEDEGGYFL